MNPRAAALPGAMGGPEMTDLPIGPWLVAADPEDVGLSLGWHTRAPAQAVPASVPGYLQQSLPGYHGIAWYWAPLTAPAGERLQIRFGSVSYRAEFWLDGQHLGTHEGSGAAQFQITPRLGVGLLSVRLLNPTTRRLDGLVLTETPSANAFDEDGYRPGRLYNYGGLTGPVDLVRDSAIGLGDAHVVADMADSTLTVSWRIRSDSDAAFHAQWHCQVSAAGELVVGVSGDIDVPAGGASGDCRVHIPHARSWSPDRPFLYDVDLVLLPGVPGSEIDTRRVRTGFRSLTVDGEGYFVLNGSRIFLRSTHTGNHVPPGLNPDRTAALLRRDLVNAKAIGLNTVRFIASRGTPEQLDLCDELGLLVYEECQASWPHGYAPRLEDRFDTEMRRTVHRDRNHPCVVIWGLLNETRDGPMFRHAAAALPVVRALDRSRLVVLSSGRWDGDLSVGSVCNPGRDEWEQLWGSEAPTGRTAAVDLGRVEQLGYVDKVGDRHLYPQVPHSVDDLTLLRTMGAGEKPVFLSEYGVGSLFDAVGESRNLEAMGADMGMPEPLLMIGMRDRYLADFHRFGLHSVFAFPEDLFQDSYRAHSAHRRQGLNAIRANPSMAGHNVTGMLDHAVTGEGMWTFADRAFKPGAVEAVSDALAALRWNIHLDPVHSLVGVPVHFELSLADDGVLTPGSYDGAVRIMGASGPIWQHDLRVTVPDPPHRPLVHPALSVDLPADLPAGQYAVTASLHRGAAPRGRTAQLTKTPSVGPLNVGRLWLPTADRRLSDWLAARGAEVLAQPPAVIPGEPPPTVLVSAAISLSKQQWRTVYAAVKAGATLILLEAADTVSTPEWKQNPPMPLEVERTTEWLYHTETIGLRHRLLAGLPGPGLLAWDWYGQTLPRARLHTAIEPEDIAVVAIGVGLPQPGGYSAGFVTAGWAVGRGRLVANTLRLLEHLDREPAAGLLLANLLESESSR